MARKSTVVSGVRFVYTRKENAFSFQTAQGFVIFEMQKIANCKKANEEHENIVFVRFDFIGDDDEIDLPSMSEWMAVGVENSMCDKRLAQSMQ